MAIPRPPNVTINSREQGHIDPYKTLGLNHDAASSQIKVAYRKLALQYHPDRLSRQFRQHNVPAAAEEQFYKQATDKFAEITTAYGMLSDPVKKREYDHLYKFGAFDDLENKEDENCNNCNTNSKSNFKYAGGFASGYSGGYATDYSGGYYRKPTVHAPNISQHHQRSDSQDSFFDDVLKTPKNYSATSSNGSFNFNPSSSSHPNNTSNNSQGQNNTQQSSNQNSQNHNREPKQGIGFSIPPLGKHISIHIPSKHEIVMAMSRGERFHNFGTRVTVTSFETKRIGNSRVGPLYGCVNGGNVSLDEDVEKSAAATAGGGAAGIGGFDDGIRVTDGNGRTYNTPATTKTNNNVNNSNASILHRKPTKKIVSTTTRIANGTHRVVKRTAYLHPDGKKEVVVEENGAVRRRYFVDDHPPVAAQSSTQDESPGRNNGPSSDPHHATATQQSSTAERETPHIPNSNSSTVGDGNTNESQRRSWYLNIFNICLAPCGGPAMVT